MAQTGLDLLTSTSQVLGRHMPPYLAVFMNFSSPDHNERPWDSITHTTELSAI